MSYAVTTSKPLHTVIDGVMRLSVTLRDELESLALTPDGRRTLLKIVITPEVITKLVPALQSDTQPVLKLSKSKLLLKHISRASLQELERLQQLMPAADWDMYLHPNTITIVAMVGTKLTMRSFSRPLHALA